MTRQEFIVAMMRYLGTDLSAYASVQLPFDDSGSIASWAKSAMQAAYQLGYLTGSKTNGKLLSSWSNIAVAALLCFFIVLQSIFAKIKEKSK